MSGRAALAVAATIVVLVAAGVACAASAGAFRSSDTSGSSDLYQITTTAVTRQNLIAQTSVDATLGYSGSYTVQGGGGGTVTWLPSTGQVIRQGGVLYRVDNGTPAFLLYGGVPLWRTLSEGMTGEDVGQLNHDLVGLGYAEGTDIAALGWDYFSWETRYALELLQEHLGISDPSGTLTAGSAVFEPAAIRVTSDLASLGGQAAGPVLSATSTGRAVSIALDASMQSELAIGDAVSVTLPDGDTTPGVVSSIGAVASGSAGSATIPVDVTLTDPVAAGTLDQAPVTVNITTATASDALTVPVTALLAQSSGGYAVEVTEPSRHLVPVTVGIFDDAAGLVQVSGNLTPGQNIVDGST
jgi:hypothetical protein